MDLNNLRTSMENADVALVLRESNLLEKMVELMKLKRAFMEEKCRVVNPPIICPKPRRQNSRLVKQYADENAVAELSDILSGNKPAPLSPPFFSGSPPVRAGNPMIRDERFHEQRGPEYLIPGGGMIHPPMF